MDPLLLILTFVVGFAAGMIAVTILANRIERSSSRRLLSLLPHTMAPHPELGHGPVEVRTISQ